MDWLLALLTSLSADPAQVSVWESRANAASTVAMSSLARSVEEEDVLIEDVAPLVEVPDEEPVCIDCNKRR
jgi:hypothetical protein